MALRKQQLFEKPSDQWDEQDHKDAILGTWWEKRKELSESTGYNEARLYFLEQFTDDPLGAVVTALRMKRFLI